MPALFKKGLDEWTNRNRPILMYSYDLIHSSKLALLEIQGWNEWENSQNERKLLRLDKTRQVYL